MSIQKTHTTHPLPDVVDAPGEREAFPFELVEEPPKHVAVPDLLDEHHIGAQGGERFDEGPYDFAFCVLRVVVYRFKGKVGFLSFGPSAAFEVSLSESAV